MACVCVSSRETGARRVWTEVDVELVAMAMTHYVVLSKLSTPRETN